MSLFATVADYRSLSVRDLLEARAQYHWHLTNLPHVIGSAIGLYLIRKSDSWPDSSHSARPHRHLEKGPRTLHNSATRDYSWPCVLVFVDRWVEESEFTSGGLHPSELVPETLYLPDGRRVPVCVVLAEPGEPAEDATGSTLWPSTDGGGGFSLLARSQQIERRATVGCLVTDGHSLYALTNRHVCGAPGSRISAHTRSGTVEIGTASDLQLSRRPFREVYATFAGDNTYLNLDAGLVDVDDANRWTASFYGLGNVREPADLNEANLGLQLIDRPVVGSGAASGVLRGTIKALFYRYKSLGGFDYVADLLIAPAAPGTSTQPGDSGTVWHVVEGDGDVETYHPVALEWGAQNFSVQTTGLNFTLATNLSTICRLLNVEVVIDHNTAARPFWGATGHYTIAAQALAGVDDPGLDAFLQANKDLISYDRAALAPGTITGTVNHAPFVPLADVPDVVWKKFGTKPTATTPGNGGRDHGGSKPEHPNHYCDIDQPRQDGKTLRELCVGDPEHVAVPFWQAFYDDAGSTQAAARGCLPFRVWQLYDAMVEAVDAGELTDFLCAAGVLAHYVGDACQPLHGSIYNDGDPNHTETHTTAKGKTITKLVGAGVHSAYESKMIDRHSEDLFTAIAAIRSLPLAPVASGHAAAVAIIALMDRTAETIPPKSIVDEYVALHGGTSKATIAGLWDAFGDATATVMADGVRVLRHLWTCAWKQGGGADGPATPIERSAVISRYLDETFLPSLDLDHIEAVLSA